jgi:hypothetical protein
MIHKFPQSPEMKRATRVLLLCLSILYPFAAHGICLMQQELELTPFPADFPLEIDTNPCGNIEIAENMQFLADNVIAYFYFYNGKIDFIRVRLTCEYKEKHMPAYDQPSLSRKQFQKILEILNIKRKFGKKLRNDVTVTGGHVSTYTEIYEHAWIRRAEYDCQEENDFGCGIKRIDIGYIEQGK